MATIPRYPSLFQINTRVWLQRLSHEAGKPITLADIDDTTIDGLAEKGFDWIWLLSVWQIGAAGRAVSRGNPHWRAEFEAILPDLTEDDICGSGFAITAYTVSDSLGGETGLAQLRERLARRGIKLMLDFVPNHTAPDHPWVKNHPEYYVKGSEDTLANAPANYLRVDTDGGPKVLAYGRDPNFAGWPDTLQLNYANPELQAERIGELTTIAGKCDGVRCDMAMLLLPEIFHRTWGMTPEPFWPKATTAVHAKYPEFIFMAEVYWDLEWTLQQQGFTYCYDKRLCDRLKDGNAKPVRDHLLAGLDYQDKLARFLENHDEPRAAATFPYDMHRSAAIITFLTPGLRFFHQGQFQGKQAKIPMHIGRGPKEPVDERIEQFYCMRHPRLKETVFREGDWKLLDCHPAWEGNYTSDAFVAFAWSGGNNERRLVVVNYSGHQSQCYVSLPWPDLKKKTWRLSDQMSDAVYDRDGQDLASHGLFLDIGPWAYHVFEVQVTAALYAEVEAPVLASLG